MTTLDSHAPYVLDTRELGHRPGISQRVRRVLPAPDGLVVGLAHVCEGTELAVDLQLEAVMEGVFVTLRTAVPVTSECARCLDETTTVLDVQAQELFAYPADGLDEDLPLMDGDLLDLEPVLRDAIVLAMPATSLCRPDCPGLCPQCGVRLADDPDHHHDAAIDARWSALRDLVDDREPVSRPTPPAQE
jgi:uncharacterized protein